MILTVKYILERFLIFILVLSPFIAWLTYQMGFAFYNFLFMYLLLLAVFQWMAQKIKLPLYFYFLLFFAIYVFLSDIFIVHKEFDYFKYITRTTYISTCLSVFVIYNMSVIDKDIKMIQIMFKILLTISFFVIIYQQLIDPTFFTPQKSLLLRSVESIDDYEIRLSSIFGYLGPIDANFLVVIITSLWVTGILIKDKYNKLAYFIYFMGFTIAFLSKSRAAWLNVIVVFLLFFNYKGITFRNFIFRGTLIFVISFFLISGLEYFGLPIKQIWNERVLEKQTKNIIDKSAGTRIIAVKAFNALFLEHPIFGVGNYKYGIGGLGKNNYELENFLKGRSSQMHVGILNLFYSYGLLGGLLFFIACVLIIKRFYRTAKLSNQWAPFYGILGMILANLTLVFLSFYTVGLLLCFVLENYYRNQLVIKEENT